MSSDPLPPIWPEKLFRSVLRGLAMFGIILGGCVVGGAILTLGLKAIALVSGTPPPPWLLLCFEYIGYMPLILLVFVVTLLTFNDIKKVFIEECGSFRDLFLVWSDPKRKVRQRDEQVETGVDEEEQASSKAGDVAQHHHVVQVEKSLPEEDSNRKVGR